MSGLTTSPVVYNTDPSLMFEASRAGTRNIQDHSSGSELIGVDDSEDLVVDLSTGSFSPMNLRNWTLMMEVTDKLGKL